MEYLVVYLMVNKKEMVEIVGVQGLPKALRHFDPQPRWTSGRGGEISLQGAIEISPLRRDVGGRNDNHFGKPGKP
jgi:ribosomal protein S7